MTADEREYRRIETYEDWRYCKMVYMNSNASFVSQFTSSPAKQRSLEIPPFDEMRRDLVANRCDSIFRETGYTR